MQWTPHTAWAGGWLLALGLALTSGPEAPAEPGCLVCDLWLEYEIILSQADREIGKLENGVIYYYSGDDPEVIEPLIRFAYRREELGARGISGVKEGSAAWARISDTLREAPNLEMEISTSAHGFFAILTSSRRETVETLWSEAAKAVPTKAAVWF